MIIQFKNTFTAYYPLNQYLKFVLVKGSKPISSAHDVPLWADKSKGVLNAVIEIPRGTHAKLEICKEEPLNPIWQDRKVIFLFIPRIWIT